MEFGYFTMPSHPPERGLREGHEWDVQTMVWADELGYGDFWVGEHHTAPWEPHPAPDYLVLEPPGHRLEIFCLVVRRSIPCISNNYV